MRLFRYREDRLPIAVILAFFAFDVLVYLRTDSVAWLAAWTLVGILPKGHICAWNHHHQHVSVFEPSVFNRLLEIVYALQTGITSNAWVLHHSLGHHVHYLDQAKDESRWRRSDGTSMGEVEYSLEVAATAYPRAWEVGRKYPKQRRVFLLMGILTLAIVAALVIARPVAALFVFVLPMVISLIFTAWATYGHHAGKSTESHFVACNNILHRGYNALTGNLGYHTAHHYKPGVHWSRLPEVHAAIAHKVPADCYYTPGLPWCWGQTQTTPTNRESAALPDSGLTHAAIVARVRAPSRGVVPPALLYLVRVDLLDYDLPAERIAQTPPEEREGARMLVVDPESATSATLTDAAIVDLAALVPPRALIVVNDTRVLAARLLAKKPETGGKVEIFLVRREGPGSYERRIPGAGDEPIVVEGEIWRALGKASKPLKFDVDLEVSDELSVRILGRAEDDGLLRVLLVSNKSIDEAIETYGQVPLPPYIKRAPTEDDHQRYQTVFARRLGAVAAPTAGLHLSQSILGKLAIAGCEVVSVTLHVGLGTFQPVVVDDLDKHPMHHEVFEVSKAAARAIAAAKREGRPILAVGTTVVRALESAARTARSEGSAEPIVACSGTTNLLLQPGEPIHVVDALLTNFHLPKSTLLALVATFVGLENLHAAYKHAIANEYRFYSYGDAMLIRRRL